MGALNMAGGLLPILSGVTSTIRAAEGVVATLNPRGSDNQALSQLQERQRLQQQQLDQSVALDRERIGLNAAQDDESRRAALRRAVARQRAQFSSSGVSSGGSSDAVLLGYASESEDELAQRTQLDNLRYRALDSEVAQQRSMNLLQATQLAERQNLNRLF